MVDALSEREKRGSCQAISAEILDWVREITTSYEQSTSTKDINTRLVVQPTDQFGYTLSARLLRYKGRLVIGEDSQLKDRILQSLHNSPIGGHSGLNVTYSKVRQLFYWPGLRCDVTTYVLECSIC